jgi:hypothetical protein
MLRLSDKQSGAENRENRKCLAKSMRHALPSMVLNILPLGHMKMMWMLVNYTQMKATELYQVIPNG